MKESKTERQKEVKHPYIERRPGVSQGKPVLAGTLIKVSQVALETERLGWTPDQIIDAHPPSHIGSSTCSAVLLL
jgi:uncharacterized protein (DUF433 family)